MVMTKKLPGCDRAFSSLSPSLPFSNSCNAIPNNNAGKGSAVIEGILADRCKTTGEIHFLQCFAVAESIPGNGGDHIRQSDAL